MSEFEKLKKEIEALKQFREIKEQLKEIRELRRMEEIKKAFSGVIGERDEDSK